jgi:branched-subunit amino acid transport protein AzlD
MNVHLGERLDLPARERWLAASTAVAAVLGVLVVVLLLAIVPLMILAHQFRWSDVGKTYLVILPFAAVGFLVVRRLPRNPIGWILLGIVLALLAPGEAGQYALLHYRHG